MLPSLTTFMPPTVTDPPVVRPAAPTYREHRQNIGPAYPTSSYRRGRGNIRAQLRTLRGPLTPSPEEKQGECERRRRKREARHNKQHRRDEKREEEKRQATQQRRPSKAPGLPITSNLAWWARKIHASWRSLSPTPGPMKKRRQLTEVPPEALIPEIIYSSEEGDLVI